jgi:hypothetical protein
MRIEVKQGADLKGIKPEAQHAIEVVDEIYKSFGQILVITSGTEGYDGDGVHKSGSLHYSGYAFDCRTRYFDSARVQTVAKAIREKLGRDYDVLVEKDHIHVEYDPKSGLGQIKREVVRFIDIVFKFLGDITPFYRTVMKYLERRKNNKK